MKDTELYQQILGLKLPWKVARVSLNTAEQRVDVYAEHRSDAKFTCPSCEQECALHDHDEERSWRHLDSCQFKTILHARVPRIRCTEHGVKQVRVPWAEPKSRFTLLFERFALDVLRETDIKGGAAILGISWDEAFGIIRRAIERGTARRGDCRARCIGVDEKGLGRGFRFATVVTDLDDGIVIDIAEGRTKAALQRALAGFTHAALAQIETVAMDMAPGYFTLVSELIGEEKIVLDRFHLMLSVNNAVDQVRQWEAKELRRKDDYRLIGSRRLWLYAHENLPDDAVDDFDELRRADLKTARAWALKENLRRLWDRPNERAANRWFQRWYRWAIGSQLHPMQRLARTLKKKLQNILSYFTHRVTNACTEGINSKIQLLKKQAYGYRNFDNFRAAVLFKCSNLDLYPRIAPT